MGEPHCCMFCSSGQLAAIRDSGVTADCVRVQTEMAGLAELLSGAAGHPEELRQALEDTQRVRQDLAEHRAWIEGSAGLFEYVAENAPHLTPRIEMLRQQHEDLDQHLQKLEGHLSASAGEEVRSDAVALLALLQQHQVSARQLNADAQ